MEITYSKKKNFINDAFDDCGDCYLYCVYCCYFMLTLNQVFIIKANLIKYVNEDYVEYDFYLDFDINYYYCCCCCYCL